MLYICNLQCGVQNTERYVIMTALMHSLFKFWSAADHTGHLIRVLRDKMGPDFYFLNAV